jgi:curved DNA-binding protein
MSTHYDTLGVSETATADEIKSAFKRLAMKHHPDRGGDKDTFQKISQANDILSNPQKRQEYDMSRKHGGNPFAHTYSHFNDDIASMFEFTFGGQRQPRRNRDITIQLAITLKQSFTGTEVEANFTVPSGKKQSVAIKVPAGIASGQSIRYPGLGDDSDSELPNGNLTVQILVENDEKYARSGANIYTREKITLVEAIGGCTRQVTNIDDTSYNVKIKPGTRPDTEYSLAGKGFAYPNTNRTGNFVVVVDVEIPAIVDPTILAKLTEILTNQEAA